MKTMHLKTAGGSNAAFTLKDLLIVVGVLAVLILVQLPSVVGAGRPSSAETCRNNLRQLIQAWQMYADDNGGRIVPNNGSTEGITGTWVKGWLDFSASYDNLNTDYLVGFGGPNSNRKYGHLGLYLETPNVFRCPSDTSTVKIFGRHQSRVRSVAMNSWMGGYAYCGLDQYRRYQKLDDVLKPAKRFVITEVRPDAINDSSFYVDMVDKFVDFPAFYHNSGNWLSFADGHIEHRRWTDLRTMPGFMAGEFIPLVVDTPNNPDLDWIRERTTDLR